MKKTCIYCGHPGVFAIHPYHKMIITVEDERRREISVDVPRYRCRLCGRSFSIAPTDSIVNASYTRHFINKVLQEYSSREISVRTLCDKWQISPSTLYAWKNEIA